MWERQPSFSCGFSFDYWTEGREETNDCWWYDFAEWRLLSIRSLLLTNLCIFSKPKVSTVNSALLPGMYFSFNLSLYINRPSKPHPHNSSAGGGRELNNNWVGWSSLMENISVWSVLSNKEFNSIHSCVLKFYQNILLRIKNRNWVVV